MTQGTIPFEHLDEPLHVEDQIVKCEIKLTRDADPTFRSLLSQILVLEPNLRLPISEIKKHRYFADIDWIKVKERRLEPVPFFPDPNKHRDLLLQEYEEISNLKYQRRAESPKKTNYFLGDISLYKINKEFENF